MGTSSVYSYMLIIALVLSSSVLLAGDDGIVAWIGLGLSGILALIKIFDVFRKVRKVDVRWESEMKEFHINNTEQTLKIPYIFVTVGNEDVIQTEYDFLGYNSKRWFSKGDKLISRVDIHRRVLLRFTTHPIPITYLDLKQYRYFAVKMRYNSRGCTRSRKIPSSSLERSSHILIGNAMPLR